MLGYEHTIQAISRNCSTDKKFYLPTDSSPLAANINVGCTPGQTLLSIKTAADEEKDSTVVQGLTTLSLMHRGTFTEYKTDKASNPIYAEYSMTRG